jgi:hypothetical protein
MRCRLPSCVGGKSPDRRRFFPPPIERVGERVGESDSEHRLNFQEFSGCDVRDGVRDTLSFEEEEM